MSKWIVDVPDPSAKRLKKDRKLVVAISHGCWGTEKREWPIPEGEDLVAFEFEYQDDDPNANRELLDANVYYDTYIEYRNSTGSRIEKIRVKPEMM